MYKIIECPIICCDLYYLEKHCTFKKVKSTRHYISMKKSKSMKQSKFVKKSKTMKKSIYIWHMLASVGLGRFIS